MILTLRTDKPEAEISLYDGSQQLAHKTWQAHRELGTTIHVVIKELLDSQHVDWNDISAVIFYEGPGSFTGLRIGAAVANALSSSNDLPVTNQTGVNWIEKGLEAIKTGKTTRSAIPAYGEPPRTTTPKK